MDRGVDSEHPGGFHRDRDLRRAIEKDPARPAYIISVSGVGYKFDDAGA